MSPRGTSLPHRGRNFRLMALCHGGVLLHSKNNTMFIKYFKPWAEVIRARFFTTMFKTSSFEHRAICIYKTFRCNESLRKFWSEYESWTGVVNRSSSMCLGCCNTAIR